MELWIRSQDRKKLCKVSRIINDMGRILCPINDTRNTYEVLGNYSEQRALEVLDEIQRHLVVINYKNDNLFCVYKMPEE